MAYTGVETEPESIHLRIQYVNQAVKLSWDRSENMNAGLIIIERSIDGEHFGRLAEIVMEGQLRGQREPVNSYLDTTVAHISTPRMFYRIRHINTEGLNTKSAVRHAVLAESNHRFRILGNPGLADSHLRVHLLGKEGASFYIRSASGEEVFKYPLRSNSEEIMVYVKNWSKGIYYASLSDGEQAASYKFEVK